MPVVGLFVVEVLVGLEGPALFGLDVVVAEGVPGDGIVELLGSPAVGFVMLGSSGSVGWLGPG
jgi:hypothetical protein